MNEIDSTNPVRLPVLRMAGLGVAACVLVALVGGLIGQSQGRGFDAGLWTLAASFPGVIVTLMMLNVLPARSAAQWAAPVLGGTVFRALVSMGLGLAVYLVVGPDKFVFFLTLVSALVVVLSLDVFVSVKLINSEAAAPGHGAAMEGA